MGRKLSLEQRQQISENMKRAYRENPNIGMTGKHHSEETKRKQSESNLGKKRNSEFREKMREASKGNTSHKGHKLSEEQKRLISERTKEGMKDKSVRDKIRNVQLGRRQTKERIQNRMEKSIPKWHMSPNKAEVKLGEILENLLPGEYKFVGDGRGVVVIGGLIPDFICEEKKKVILMHGDYWHKDEDTNVVVQRYANEGYDCLVIWERQLKRENTVNNKIEMFHAS